MEKDIILIVAIAAAVILVVNQIVKLLQARMLHRTVREALSRDSALTPALLDKIDNPRRKAWGGDDRIGLLLIAIGAAMIVFALLEDNQDTVPASVFPLFVGAVLCGRHWYVARRGADS